MPDSSDEKETASRRDEAKRKADVEKAFKETIHKATSFLRLVKKRPDLWVKLEMQELRTLTCDVSGNPNL